jgi:hypothetical protein
MLADPRAIGAFDRYYAEWLWLDDLAPLHQQLGQPDYDAFVGADNITPETRGHVSLTAISSGAASPSRTLPPAIFRRR